MTSSSTATSASPVVSTESVNASATPQSTHCINCGAVKPRYKCPACKAPYCSAACSKLHKASEACAKRAEANKGGQDGTIQSEPTSAPTTSASSGIAGRKRERDGTTDEEVARSGQVGEDGDAQLQPAGSSSLMTYAAAPHSHETKKHNRSQRRPHQGTVQPDDEDDFIEEVYDDDGNIQILGTQQLVAIRSNKKLRDMLRTKELRSMINIVDKSRSRLDALEAAMHNSYDFNSLCDYLLGIIYENSASPQM